MVLAEIEAPLAHQYQVGTVGVLRKHRLTDDTQLLVEHQHRETAATRLPQVLEILLLRIFLLGVGDAVIDFFIVSRFSVER